jgi:hypothetical protein
MDSNDVGISGRDADRRVDIAGIELLMRCTA